MWYSSHYASGPSTNFIFLIARSLFILVMWWWSLDSNSISRLIYYLYLKKAVKATTKVTKIESIKMLKPTTNM